MRQEKPIYFKDECTINGGFKRVGSVNQKLSDTDIQRFFQERLASVDAHVLENKVLGVYWLKSCGSVFCFQNAKCNTNVPRNYLGHLIELYQLQTIQTSIIWEPVSLIRVSPIDIQVQHITVWPRSMIKLTSMP